MDTWNQYLEALEKLRQLQENARREPLGVQARRRAALQKDQPRPL